MKLIKSQIRNQRLTSTKLDKTNIMKSFSIAALLLLFVCAIAALTKTNSLSSKVDSTTPVEGMDAMATNNLRRLDEGEEVVEETVEVEEEESDESSDSDEDDYYEYEAESESDSDDDEDEYYYYWTE